VAVFFLESLSLQKCTVLSSFGTTPGRLQTELTGVLDVIISIL